MAVQPRVEGAQPVVDLAELLPRQAEVEARRRGRSERQHARAVGLGDAEDLGDDRDRQHGAVAVDEVDRALRRRETVEQLGRDLLGALAQLLDGLDREHPRDQLAVARVLGRLDHQQRRRRDRMHGFGGGAERDLADRVVAVHRVAGAEVAAGEHLLDEVVAGRHVAELAAVDGAGRAEVLDGVPHVAALLAGADQPRLQVAPPGRAPDEDGQEPVRHAPVGTRRRARSRTVKAVASCMAAG